MKKIFFLSFCMAMLMVLPAQASIQSAILEDIIEESPAVWGIGGSESEEDLRFIPDRGGIKVCKAEKKIIVGFCLSDDDIDFYKQTFSDGSRKPIGVEIEIVDYLGVFNSGDIIDYDESFSENVRYNDNPMLDNEHIYSICINDPTKLKANTLHTVEIEFSSCENVSLGKFAVQVQLVGDIRKLSESYPDIYSEYSAKVQAELFSWWTVLGGSEDVDGNNFFNIREPNIRFQSDEFFGWPEGTETGHDRYLWNVSDPKNHKYIGDYEPYHCGFGDDPWNNSSSDDDSDDSGGTDDLTDTGTGIGETETNPGSEIDSPLDDPDHDPDLHISSFRGKEKGEDDDEYRHKIQKTLAWGESFEIVGEAKVRNESSREARDVDLDYRVDGDRDRFDENDTKIDEDSDFDIDSGEKVTEHMRGVKISVSDDGKSVKISGDKSESFPVVNGIGEIYIFVDVEEKGRDDGDQDISSESDKDEYIKIEIIVVVPNFKPQGYVDTVDCSKIRGWAKDQNTSDSLEIHVYQMDNLRNNRSFLGAFDANSYRSDLGGNWGFVWYPPNSIKDGRTRILQFFAINVPRGSNPLLTNGEVQFTCYAAVAGKKPVYRIYSTVKSCHFFTISENEKNKVLSWSGWRGEGVAWLAFSSRKSETVPIYRLYNGRGGHLFTRSLSERNKAVSGGWRYEGVGFYAYSNQKDGTVPVYRIYKSKTGNHHYTTSKRERDRAISSYGYVNEGIAFYAYPK